MYRCISAVVLPFCLLQCPAVEAEVVSWKFLSHDCEAWKIKLKLSAWLNARKDHF